MLVLLGSDILCDGVGKPLLFLRLPVVGQCEFDIGGKRLLPIGKPQEEGLCLVKLLVRQPRGGDVNAGLETANLVSLPPRFGFGTVREILAEAFTVEPAEIRKTTSPLGFVNCEIENELFGFMPDLPRQLANLMSGEDKFSLPVT